MIEVNEEEWVSDSDDEAPTQDPKFYNNNKDVTNLTKVRDQGLFKSRFRYLFLDLFLVLDSFFNFFFGIFLGFLVLFHSVKLMLVIVLVLFK